jgi:hypothetical protein
VQPVRLPAALALAALLACSSEPETPEARVRAVLAAIESAAEARDVKAMKEHLSERYADSRGNDKQAVGGIAALHFMRNQSVYLLTRVAAVELPAPGEARADVLVAMAGTPIDAPEALVGLRADLYRFDVTLRDEAGSWRVTSAVWTPASVDDFR